MPPEIPPLARNYRLATPLMRSEEVARAQERLILAGQSLRRDGIYGMATQAAVIAFQRSRGMTSDGVLGALTWRALFHTEAGDELEVEAADIVTPGQVGQLQGFHRRFDGGHRWRITEGAGLEIEGAGRPLAGRRLAEQVITSFLPQITTASVRFKVPVELVVATILTESSGRPTALRMEPGCDRANPERTPHRVSLGLMQTLLSTARGALRQPDLRLDDLANPATSIAAGMAYMWGQARETGFDPPLVAAAYNAGRIAFNGGRGNPWRVRQFPIGTGAHCTRFVGFFNAAWDVLEGGVALKTPAFRFTSLLR